LAEKFTTIQHFSPSVALLSGNPPLPSVSVHLPDIVSGEVHPDDEAAAQTAADAPSDLGRLRHLPMASM